MPNALNARRDRPARMYYIRWPLFAILASKPLRSFIGERSFRV